jgi:hypothetical protein
MRWCVVFCNSDPQIVKLMMKFFRRVCNVPEIKFKPQIQIHPNIEENIAKQYWSKITGLPIQQFRKTLKQVSKSSKFKRDKQALPYGVFRLYISDVNLVHKIRGWLKGLAK